MYSINTHHYFYFAVYFHRLVFLHCSMILNTCGARSPRGDYPIIHPETLAVCSYSWLFLVLLRPFSFLFLEPPCRLPTHSRSGRANQRLFFFIANVPTCMMEAVMLPRPKKQRRRRSNSRYNSSQLWLVAGRREGKTRLVYFDLRRLWVSK